MGCSINEQPFSQPLMKRKERNPLTLLTARKEISAPTTIDTTSATILTLESPTTPPSLIGGALLANSPQFPITTFYDVLTQTSTSTISNVVQIDVTAFSAVRIIPTDVCYYRLTTS